jgi:hypothetical protein
MSAFRKVVVVPCSSRVLSLYNLYTMSNTNGNKMDKAGKRQKFLDVFPVLRTELVDYVKSTGSPEEVWGWFEKVSFPYYGVVGEADG